MTSEEIDVACQRFLQSKLSAESFLNDYLKKNKIKLSCDECEFLLSLFYQLENMDTEVLRIIEKMTLI